MVKKTICPVLPKLIEAYAITIAKEVPHVNSGGCAIVSLALYKVAKELKLKPKILVETFGNYHAQVMNGFFNGGTSLNTYNRSKYFMHSLLEIGDKKIHAKTNPYYEAQDHRDYIKLTQSNSIKKLKELTQDPEQWNPTFNRNYIPTIHKLVGI